LKPQAMHGLIIGAIAGAALAAFMYSYNNLIWDFLLVPFAALMGAAPWYLQKKEE